jgi:signal recognition particle receptor subunit beta
VDSVTYGDGPAPTGSDAHANRYLPATVQRAVKILVVGSFGVGKTTLIGTVSEIRPLHTEEYMTQAGVGIDDLGDAGGGPRPAGLDTKTTTTVAMDFGRITVSPRLALYLFGTPGQRRFWNLWEGLGEGAVGVLVLVDTRRLEASFEVLDQLEEHRQALPFAVAVNRFPDSARHNTEDLRAALDLLPETPIIDCDARDRTSSVDALIALVHHASAQPDTPQEVTS